MTTSFGCAPDADARLRAINPEAGIFGVAPGTGLLTNPTAVAALDHGVIFTNVALTDDGDIWWEGLTPETPDHLIDWQGQDWTPEIAAETGRKAAHSNARYTVAARQIPTIDPAFEDPEGVPVDAILFGGRRATNVPLALQSADWEHGVFLGATISSEQTAAAEGIVGQLRRDPFAMLPFCGYHMADYWAHWLDVGARFGDRAPKIFAVNWFRKGPDGSFLWPGFGDNIRVLDWVVRRLEAAVPGRRSALGVVPADGELDTSGLSLTSEALTTLTEVDGEAWAHEADLAAEYFATFGDRLPDAIAGQLTALRRRLGG